MHVLEAARRGDVDAVAVWKLDRWGRSALDVVANIQSLADAGVRFVAVSQGLDVKPRRRCDVAFMLTVLAAAAEFEPDLIRERTHLRLDRAAGARPGRATRASPRPQARRSLSRGAFRSKASHGQR
jgi:DNA invertase Pin-like site-specific DNA recombinase